MFTYMAHIRTHKIPDYGSFGSGFFVNVTVQETYYMPNIENW